MLSGGPLDTDKVVVLFNDGPITLRHRMGQESKDVPAWLPVDGQSTARHGDRQDTIRQKLPSPTPTHLSTSGGVYQSISSVCGTHHTPDSPRACVDVLHFFQPVNISC